MAHIVLYLVFHRVFNTSNTAADTSVSITVYLSEAPEFTCFSGAHLDQSFCRPLFCLLFLSLYIIVLSALTQFIASDYLFGISKLFVYVCMAFGIFTSRITFKCFGTSELNWFIIIYVIHIQYITVSLYVCVSSLTRL